MNKFLLTIIFGTLFCSVACNKDPDRTEEYMSVYIPLVDNYKAERLRDVPIMYNTVNLVENIKLSGDRDTTFNIGIYCGGSLMPQQDIAMNLSLATDSLASLQKMNIPQSAYQLLPAEYYTVGSWNVTIPQGEEMAYFPVTIRTTAIPRDEDYVLPVRIERISAYELDNARSFILLAIKFK